jgi:hypothetical protein
MRKNVRYHEVNVSDYPLFLYPPYELVLASKMVDVVKYEKLDLLHVHYAIPHASAAITAKQVLAEEGIHLPVITTLHGTDITLLGKDASFEPVISFAINKSDAVSASLYMSIPFNTFLTNEYVKKYENPQAMEYVKIMCNDLKVVFKRIKMDKQIKHLK